MYTYIHTFINEHVIETKHPPPCGTSTLVALTNLEPVRFEFQFQRPTSL